MYHEASYNESMMTSEEYLAKMRDPKWYGEQDENGVDLSLIRENLKLTPEERLLKADAGRRSAVEHMEHARAKIEERLKAHR